ncbi:HIRAN domain-containing protein [Antarcticirhabdus aurantiaca]|uniref:HIRAN domain-containing protein n=1 Tax=Antarcticirhabdus aurantiaca TaxID=2606717 RepID=UPI00131E61F8|nr:HIRAN domain-containing protein [Antarcticirhabdus aurantiaca]
MTSLDHLRDTPAGVELDRIGASEPSYETAIAGLQFHAYAGPDGLGGLVMPSAGDRLSLVRAPENPHDTNAIEVWWRNSHRLGHLPRLLAADLSPAMDAGASVRAYVLDAGTGGAWSARVLLVGEGLIHIVAEPEEWKIASYLEPCWDDEDVEEPRTVTAPPMVPDDADIPF